MKLWLVRLREAGYPEWFTRRLYDTYGNRLDVCEMLTQALLDDDHRAGLGVFSAKLDSEAVLVHDALTLCRKLGFPLASILETAGRFTFTGLLEGRSIPWVAIGAIGGMVIEGVREIF